MSKNTWLAVHIYYPPPWEDLLIQSIRPLVDRFQAKEQIQGYFFIRYWERGPHIRFRLMGKDDVLQDIVKPQINECFQNYFRESPSLRIEPSNLAQLSGESSWFPNQSIQYIEYEPELARYGSQAGVDIAEKQFEYSSSAILSSIEESNNYDYERQLAIGIQMHLSFAYSVGMNISEAIQFFTQVYESFLHFFNQGDKKFPIQSEREEFTQIIDSIHESFLEQQKTLVPFHSGFWNALNEKFVFEQEWLNKWIYGMQKIGRKLRYIDENGLVERPGQSINPPVDQYTFDSQNLWFIYSSYLHMTNNRLGIHNRDEAHICYLIKSSLERI